jgi:hypothetical protein
VSVPTAHVMLDPGPACPPRRPLKKRTARGLRRRPRASRPRGPCNKRPRPRPGQQERLTSKLMVGSHDHGAPAVRPSPPRARRRRAPSNHPPRCARGPRPAPALRPAFPPVGHAPSPRCVRRVQRAVRGLTRAWRWVDGGGGACVRACVRDRNREREREGARSRAQGGHPLGGRPLFHIGSGVAAARTRPRVARSEMTRGLCLLQREARLVLEVAQRHLRHLALRVQLRRSAADEAYPPPRQEGAAVFAAAATAAAWHERAQAAAALTGQPNARRPGPGRACHAPPPPHRIAP